MLADIEGISIPKRINVIINNQITRYENSTVTWNMEANSVNKFSTLLMSKTYSEMRELSCIPEIGIAMGVLNIV